MALDKKKTAPAMKAAARKSQGGAMKKAAMKRGRPSKIAKGRMAKALVFRGSKEKTVGGLKKESLMKNKRGKVVSKRASALGKRRYRQIEAWVDSVMEARKALHVSGFVAINGKTLQGKALYVKSKALCMAKLGQAAASSTSAPAISSVPSPARASAAAAAQE